MVDNYSFFKAHDDEQAKWLKSRPKCCRCDEPIQDDFCYDLGDGLYCPDCLNEYRRSTDNYVKE